MSPFGPFSFLAGTLLSFIAVFFLGKYKYFYWIYFFKKVCILLMNPPLSSVGGVNSIANLKFVKLIWSLKIKTFTWLDTLILMLDPPGKEAERTLSPNISLVLVVLQLCLHIVCM